MWGFVRYWVLRRCVFRGRWYGHGHIILAIMYCTCRVFGVRGSRGGKYRIYDKRLDLHGTYRLRLNTHNYV